jgi:hypothetical protein
MCIALGSWRFFVHHPDAGWRGHHALSITPRAADIKRMTKEQREQSSPQAWSHLRTRAKAETLVECHLSGRFYGKGYERGDLVSIAAVAHWLHRVWPKSTVFYGGDSSDELDEWTPEFEADLWNHMASPQGRDYFASWNSTFAGGAGGGKPVQCDFCKIDAITNGGGGDKTFWYCPSCHKKWERSRDGTLTDREDSFDDGDLVPQSMKDEALYDLVVKVALGAAEAEEMKAHRDSVSVSFKTFYRELTPAQRIDLYERAGTMLLERQQALIKAYEVAMQEPVDVTSDDAATSHA